MCMCVCFRVRDDWHVFTDNSRLYLQNYISNIWINDLINLWKNMQYAQDDKVLRGFYVVGL